MAKHNATCQCGSLVLEAISDPDFVIACNCRACQKRSGSPFGVGTYFRKDVVTVGGEQQSWERAAESGRRLENIFCPRCGTTLFWTLDMRPDHIGVPGGQFDTPPPTPIRAIWTEEKHDWVTFPEDWPTFPKGSPA
jgi:hypothetical protein